MKTYNPHETSRRQFIKGVALGALAISLPSISGCKKTTSTIKMPKIGLQLWSVREDMEKDIPGTLSRVRDLGIEWVETAFFPDSITIFQAGKLLKDRGLKVCSIHCEMPEGDQKEIFLEMAEAYECKNMIWHGWAEPKEMWDVVVAKHKKEDGVKEFAVKYNEANAFAKSKGLTFGLHNHWWECQRTEEGKLPYQLLIENMDKDIFFEVDAYWAKVAGLNPADMISEAGDRVRFLHIKDGPALSPDDFMVPAGKGSQDMKSVATAGKKVEYMVIEFDKCQTDIYAAIRESYDYLVKNSLAEG